MTTKEFRALTGIPAFVSGDEVTGFRVAVTCKTAFRNVQTCVESYGFQVAPMGPRFPQLMKITRKAEV